MLQVTLELKDDKDESLILPLLERLGIRFSTIKKAKLSPESMAYHRRIIEEGVELADFDNYLQEFNESRQDRSLPFRDE